MAKTYEEMLKVAKMNPAEVLAKIRDAAKEAITAEKK